MTTNSQDPSNKVFGSKAVAREPAAITGTSTTPVSGYSPFHEIDMVDIGVIFWSRRRLLLSVFFVCLILAIVAVVLKKPTYEYTTTLQLATSISQNSGSVVPLMPASSAAQILQATYIPDAVHQNATQEHDASFLLHIPRIIATGAADGTTVVLSCETAEKMGPICTTIEKMAAQAFVIDNAMFVETAKSQLVSLQNEAKVLQTQLDQLNQIEISYSAEHRAGSKGRNTSHGSKSVSVTGTNTAVSSNDVLDIISDAQIQSVHAQVLAARAQVLKQLADNSRAQLAQEQSIAQAQTRIVNAGLRSIQPVGLSRRIVLGVGILLSLFFAVFAALVASYMAQVRTRMQP